MKGTGEAIWKKRLSRYWLQGRDVFFTEMGINNETRTRNRCSTLELR